MSQSKYESSEMKEITFMRWYTCSYTMPIKYVRHNEAAWIDACYYWVRQINEEFIEAHIEQVWREFNYYWQRLLD